MSNLRRLQLGQVEVVHLCASRFRLDGGAMFGVVPRPLWEKQLPPDERHRVELACNCLLVRGAGRLTLVDTGCGDRFTAKEQEIFGFDPALSMGRALAQAGAGREEISQVILTHLHFDHAGGALRLESGDLRPAFPRAAYLVQRGEWEDALEGRSIMKNSYRPAELRALEDSGQLRFLEGDTQLDAQLSTFVTGGHTAHHQGVLIRGSGRTLVYPGELVPTRAHLRLHWNMAYDMSPYQTLTRKREFLEQAAAHHWIVAWNHDPGVPWSRLSRQGENWAAVEAED